MREYAKISPAFWMGETGRKLRGHPHGQIVAMYLMTCPHANMLGMYYMPLVTIAHETGLTMEQASQGMAECVATGFCKFCPASDFVWVINMARHQMGDEFKEADKFLVKVRKTYNTMPKHCPFLGEWFDMYQGVYHLKQRRGDAAPTAAPMQPAAVEQKQPAPLPAVEVAAPQPQPLPAAKSTAAPAPAQIQPPVDETPDDRKKRLWQQGKALLEAEGSKDGGAIIGRWIRLVNQNSPGRGEELTLSAIETALKNRPAAAKEYITGVLFPKKDAGHGRVNSAWQPEPYAAAADEIAAANEQLAELLAGSDF